MMLTMALEIFSDGVRYCGLPDPLFLGGDNDFTAVFVPGSSVVSL